MNPNHRLFRCAKHHCRLIMVWYPLTPSCNLEKVQGLTKWHFRRDPKHLTKLLSDPTNWVVLSHVICLNQNDIVYDKPLTLQPKYCGQNMQELQNSELDYIQARIKHLSNQKKKKDWNAPQWQTVIMDFLLILASCISGSTGEIFLQNRQPDRPTDTRLHVGHSVDVVLWSRGKGFGSDLAWIPAHNYFRSASI